MTKCFMCGASFVKADVVTTRGLSGVVSETYCCPSCGREIGTAATLPEPLVSALEQRRTEDNDNPFLFKPQWEYDVIDLGVSRWRQTAQLLQAGEQGWELVGVSTGLAYLKRPKGVYPSYLDIIKQMEAEGPRR